MHRLVVIGSLMENVRLVKKAKERGYYTIVCDGYENGPAKKIADQYYDINVRDVDAIAQMCLEEKADGIIGSFSDIIFEKITEIAAKAGIKWYATPGQIPQYRDKSVAKKLMDSLGIRVPKYRLLSGDFQNDQISDLHFPLVVKPVTGWGSKGIFVAHNPEEIRSKYNEAADANSDAQVQVEEFSQGREYNMTTWVIDGKVHVISIADREKNPQTGDTVPLLNRIVYPALHIHEVIDEAREVLQKFIDATGQKSGPLSMQFFYNEYGVEVCEIAGRIFGYEHEMVDICSGLNIEDMLLDYVYDEKSLKKRLSTHSPFFTKCCQGLYFVGKQGKVIKDQTMIDKLGQDPHVLEAIKFYKDGEKIDNYGPNPYLARYYIMADSREKLDQIAERFFDLMYVEDTEGHDLSERFILEKE